MSDQKGEGWSEYQKLVLAELKRLSREIVSMEKRVSHEIKTMEDRFSRDMKDLNKNYESMLIDITMLKVKSGLWGGLTGVVAAIATTMIRNSINK